MRAHRRLFVHLGCSAAGARDRSSSARTALLSPCAVTDVVSPRYPAFVGELQQICASSETVP